MSTRVAILGATGFVGSAVVASLVEDQVEVRPVSSPRLSTQSRAIRDLRAEAAQHEAAMDLAAAFEGADAVINAAGCPDASSMDGDLLYGANALVPAIVLEACIRAGVKRLVHVSSAVVQNDKPTLDDSEDLRPFSPYSESKVAGEGVLREEDPAGVRVVRYRPPSVHAPGRRVTRMIARIASSPFATVATPGDQPTPQAQLPNVASAIAYLAVCASDVPAVVVHPSEGVTTGGLMRDLGGGREPQRLPRSFATWVVRLAKLAGRFHRPTAANARRVELLWLGQSQARSWLDDSEWRPVVGPEGWLSLASAATEGSTS